MCAFKVALKIGGRCVLLSQTLPIKVYDVSDINLFCHSLNPDEVKSDLMLVVYALLVKKIANIIKT